MSKRDIHESTKLVEMQEEELKQFLLNRYEACKDLEEKKRKDPEIAKLNEQLADYKQKTYSDIKLFKAQLKAARAIAKARGIEFKLPKDALNDD